MTGGAGYIGSHTIVELINSGHSVVAVDNLVNSSVKTIKRAELITKQPILFYNIDIRDRIELEEVFESHRIDCCIHCACLKVISESFYMKREYYDNNVVGTIALTDIMSKYGCKNIVFSSSAAVYGEPDEIPVTENCPKEHCTTPYAWTIHLIEKMLNDLYISDNDWNAVILRSFNAIGAHPSGLIGENPKGIPNNLMPYITQVVVGKRGKLHIFGNDYDTPDGTGVRDYIHVVDLARGHVSALKAITQKCGVQVYNLGTGKGYSVLDVVNAFDRVNGIKIPYVIDPRRQGDIGACYSSPAKALSELGWKAEYDIDDMCRDSWNWQRMNLNGY